MSLVSIQVPQPNLASGSLSTQVIGNTSLFRASPYLSFVWEFFPTSFHMESYICNSIFPLIFQLEKSIAQKEKRRSLMDCQRGLSRFVSKTDSIPSLCVPRLYTGTCCKVWALRGPTLAFMSRTASQTSLYPPQWLATLFMARHSINICWIKNSGLGLQPTMDLMTQCPVAQSCRWLLSWATSGNIWNQLWVRRNLLKCSLLCMLGLKERKGSWRGGKDSDGFRVRYWTLRNSH